MKRGLKAEMDEKYEAAEKLYSQARAMDRPTLRRCVTWASSIAIIFGDWDKARATFRRNSCDAGGPSLACVACRAWKNDDP